ncbi:MAG: endonuclease/exonuclease/phosphatase family protein [Anaerolineae bacterium]|jgi:endonuclease/exonuclease/phosphatase (EEP) superfamily protein YafD|nr:endonuclease/exonuclease/phosphatase family protein [Anaerolineae bacterium]
MIENTNAIPAQNSLRYIVGIFYFAFRALVGAYAMSVLGALLIHFFISEDTSDLAGFVNSTLYFTMMGSLILLPITIILRRVELILMLTPPVIIWLIWTIPLLLPKTAPIIPPNTPEITVLTYNILVANKNFDGIERILTEADADVVALQELDYDVSDFLEANLKDEYPYMVMIPRGIPGMGIMSKYPLEDCENWREVSQYQQRCLLTLADETIAFYNTHPNTPLSPDGFNKRRVDVRSILDRALADKAAGLQVVIAGDWNAPPQTIAYQQVTSHFEDAFVRMGQGIGFTYRLSSYGILHRIGGLPILRIDYVFYHAPMVALEATVWHENAGSDHMPVFVRLAMP